MTAGDLILAAARRIRIISGSDPLDGDSENDALLRLNDWIDDLKNEHLTVFARLRTTWTITSATSYTVGTGGTVNIDRPISPEDIENIGYQDTSLTPTTETLLGPTLSEDAFALIPQKTQTAIYPYYWYYNPTFPLGALKPWPVPTSSTLQGVIYTGIGVSEVTLATVLSLPPGYRRFLREGLALELAPEFHVSDPAVLGPISRNYEEAKGNVKRKNARLVDLTPPDSLLLFSGGPQSNIYTGP